MIRNGECLACGTTSDSPESIFCSICDEVRQEHSEGEQGGPMNFEIYTNVGKTYTSAHWTSIDGWNQQGAFVALKLIHDFQRQHGCWGHVVEIGVHDGQYFFALSLLTDVENTVEHSIAIDVFDNQARNVDQSGCASLERFKENAHKVLGAPGTVRNYQKFTHYIQADSLGVTPEFLGAFIMKHCRLQTGVRLISIDGGHTRTHVLNDLRLAERSICHGGVAILDDFMHPKWPGVSEGAHIYCSDPNSRMVPFAYGNKKLYLTTFDYAKRYFELFRDVEEGVKDRKEVELWNRPLVWVYFE